jgi:hypothetical protein
MAPVVTAGLLLAARSLATAHGFALVRVDQMAPAHDLAPVSVDQIVVATGASRTRAYEIKDAIVALLPTLARPPGRPRIEHAPAPPACLAELTSAALRFVMQHPGCVHSGERASYAEPYRRFVIELREQHADVMRSAFAEAIQIPLGTLDDWMRVASLDELAANGTSDALDQGATSDIVNPLDTGEISNTVNPQNKEIVNDTITPLNQDVVRDIASLSGEHSVGNIAGSLCGRDADNGTSPLDRQAVDDIASPLVTRVVRDVINPADTCMANDIANPLDKRAVHDSTHPLEDRAIDHAANPPRVAAHDAKHAQIETVLAAWRVWQGNFRAFCDHVRRDHRLELGNTLIGSILFEHGARTPARRGGRSRDEEALRGSFETFFPGAQWVGDGKQLGVVLDGKTFAINLELVVDAASDAAVGISVRDAEDSAAVVEAFAHGAETTGEAPLALLLDNRPSNHTPDVDAALGDTLRIRATPERPQNKAHVEGAFGLFAQKVPPIELDTRDPHALAKTIAQLVATTFFRALNRAPRRDRDGKTRVELYAQDVTPEQREAARIALRERMRKQELARQTRAARIDPVIRAHLDDAFARLGLLDPERHIRDAIACYSHDSIVDAIAIFTGKRTAGTLPAGVDARYLLGIVRNLHHRHESESITEELIRERLAARDRFLEPLVHQRDTILAAADADVGATLITLVDRLMRAERAIDRHVWLEAAADLVTSRAHDERVTLAKRAARRIHTAFRISTHDRDHLERAFLRRLWPLE